MVVLFLFCHIFHTTWTVAYALKVTFFGLSEPGDPRAFITGLSGCRTGFNDIRPADATNSLSFCENPPDDDVDDMLSGQWWLFCGSDCCCCCFCDDDDDDDGCSLYIWAFCRLCTLTGCLLAGVMYLRRRKEERHKIKMRQSFFLYNFFLFDFYYLDYANWWQM